MSNQANRCLRHIRVLITLFGALALYAELTSGQYLYLPALKGWEITHSKRFPPMKKAALRGRSPSCSHPQLVPQTHQQAKANKSSKAVRGESQPQANGKPREVTPSSIQSQTFSEFAFQRTISLSFMSAPSSLPLLLVRLVSQSKRLNCVKPITWAAQRPHPNGDQKMMSEDGYKAGEARRDPSPEQPSSLC